MLVWLASYPRSGNTLLRQVLKTCFDLSSCEGLEPVPANFREPDGIRDEFYGAYFVEGDPEEFYRRARTGSELVLIKSHQLPRDDAKAVYVVRDGRLALRSYVKFQDTYHPGTSSFEKLLLGDHPYGEWSSHFRAWCEVRGGQTLLVRFEELVDADTRLLARLAEFLGLPGPLRPWVNPQAELQRRDPAFFGRGSREWSRDPFWTDTRLRQFHTLHGPLLVHLGYATQNEAEALAYPADSGEARLLLQAHELTRRNSELQATCDERLEEIDRLAAACGERLTELARLSRECQWRDRCIAELTADRAALSQRLAELDEQLRTLDTELHRIQRSRLFRIWRRLAPR
jgi:hypothetical protein